MTLELEEKLRESLPSGEDPFEWFLEPRGPVFRNVKHRSTYRWETGGRAVFVKRHLACGWKEVLKEWYRLREPIVSARNEWEAIRHLRSKGLPLPEALGFGERGLRPAEVESFIVLEAIEEHETLEFFKPGWLGFEGARFVALKHALLQRVAEYIRDMHAAGVNHRDCYINHLLFPRELAPRWQPGDELPIRALDFHRARIRSTVPRGALQRDLAALLYSALDSGLTSTDCLRFLRAYLGESWKSELGKNRSFWRKVCRRALRLYRSFYRFDAPHCPQLVQAAAS